MKAVLCKHHGPPSSLVVEEVSSPQPGPGQVVISVHAAGVNFPDTLIIEGRYQFQPDLPFSPGGEVSGVIKKVGAGVKDFQPGDRVIALTSWGGFAEEVCTDASRVIAMPASMDFESAAAFLLTYGTSHHALKDRGTLRPGETLLVLGAAGGVGIAAVELGKAMGAHVIAAVSSDEKAALCRAHGADDTIQYTRDDLRACIKTLTNGKGVDVVYDPVGGDFTEPALRSCAWNGRYLVVGFAAGPIPSIPLNLPLLKGCSIVGVFWGAFRKQEPQRSAQNIQELMDLHARGLIRPHISKVYPLEQAANALEDLLNRKVQGKAILTTGRS